MEKVEKYAKQFENNRMRKVIIALRDAWKGEAKDPGDIKIGGSGKHCGSQDAREDSKRRRIGLMFGFKSSCNLIYFRLLALLYSFSAGAEAFLCLAKRNGVLSSMATLAEAVVILLLVVSMDNTLNKLLHNIF
jgi:hypothetical protein